MKTVCHTASNSQYMTDIYSSSKKYRHCRAKRRNKKAHKAICVCLICTVLLLCGGFFGYRFVVNSVAKPAPGSPAVYSEGSKVSGLDISGKTYDEALSFLNAHKKELVPRILINVQIAGATEKLTQDSFTYDLDLDGALNSLNSLNSSVTVKAVANEGSVKSNAKNIADKYDANPQNATVAAFHPFAENRFEINESRDGLSVDENDLEAKLSKALQNGGGDVSAKTKTIPAELSADELSSKLVMLSEYKTYTSTDTEAHANSTHNMNVALEACNEYNEIKPGEVWSFNECTGDSNQESNGYVASTVIADGNYTQGVGGGICQASSTIYNAAIRANLDVVERAPHKWASSYVPTGLDATIDYGNIDLKLKNNSDSSVYLECRLVDNTLYAAFWGIKSNSYDKIVICNEDGPDDDTGYSVSAWREYVKGGEVVDREELPGSHYDSGQGHLFEPAEQSD